MVQTLPHQGQIVVIERVSAEVYSIRGDVLLRFGTIRRIEHLLESRAVPQATVFLYQCA